MKRRLFSYDSSITMRRIINNVRPHVPAFFPAAFVAPHLIIQGDTSPKVREGTRMGKVRPINRYTYPVYNSDKIAVPV
jgi:hypothetical protein